MKKKTVKKLVLLKETVISLQENPWQVAGGATLRCEYSGYATCATCNQVGGVGTTCGTNLC